MQHAHNPVVSGVIEGPVDPVTKEGDRREDHEDKDLEPLEGAVLKEEEGYDEQKLHHLYVEFDIWMHSIQMSIRILTLTR